MIYLFSYEISFDRALVAGKGNKVGKIYRIYLTKASKIDSGGYWYIVFFERSFFMEEGTWQPK